MSLGRSLRHSESTGWVEIRYLSHLTFHAFFTLESSGAINPALDGDGWEANYLPLYENLQIANASRAVTSNRWLDEMTLEEAVRFAISMNCLGIRIFHQEGVSVINDRFLLKIQSILAAA